MESKNEVNEKSCWNCKFHNLGNDTLLGKCKWFVKNGKGEEKPIPSNVVDKGCKQFVRK